MSDKIVDEIKETLKAEGIEPEVDSAEAVEVEVEQESMEEPTYDRELSDFEKEQVKKGWDPSGVKSAEEFARAEPLFEKIKAQSKQLKTMSKAIEEMKALMSKQEQVAYQKAMMTLKQEKDEAILRGDLNTVKAIEQQERTLDTQPQTVHPAVTEFLDQYGEILKSSSYEEMQIADFVKQRDNELVAKNLDPETHMKMLEEHMKKQFPAYFGGQKEHVARTSSVETGTGSNVARSSGAVKKYTMHDLSDGQKKVARDFEKLGIMKVNDYIKSLVELGELK